MDRSDQAISDLAKKSNQDETHISKYLSNEEGHLSTNPPSAYLKSNEQVKFVFFNDAKGVGLGGNKHQTRRPTASGGTVILFTAHRIIILIGRSSDEMASVPYDLLDNIEYSFGRLKHRISITAPNVRYHLWVSIGCSKSDIEDAVEYAKSVKENSHQPDLEFRPLQEVGDIPEKLGKDAERGRESNMTEGENSETVEGEDAISLYRDESPPIFVGSHEAIPVNQEGDRFELLSRNQHVRETWLAESQSESGFVNVPPMNYVHDDECILFTISNRKSGVAVGGRTNTTTPNSDGFTLGIFTDTRVLLVVPQKNGDEIFEVPYSQLEDIEYVSGFTKQRLVLTTESTNYHMWVGKYTDLERIVSSVEYLTAARETAAETLSIEEESLRYDPERGVLFDKDSPSDTAQPKALNEFLERDIPPALHPKTELLLTDVTGGNMRAELKILDRDTGKAEIKTKGLEIGMRSYSSSEFEKEGYEADLHQFIVKEDAVEIVAEDPDGGKGAKQTIRRTFDQIIGVDYSEDKSKSAITLHTDTSIYRIEFQGFGEKGEVTTVELVKVLRSKIGNGQSGGGGRTIDTTSTPTSSTSKLRELAELRDDGIITDEEFQEKKESLLEDI